MVSNHKFTEWQFILRIKNIFIDELNEHVPVGISTDTVVDSGEGVNTLPLAAPPLVSRETCPPLLPLENLSSQFCSFLELLQKKSRALCARRDLIAINVLCHTEDGAREVIGMERMLFFCPPGLFLPTHAKI